MPCAASVVRAARCATPNTHRGTRRSGRRAQRPQRTGPGTWAGRGLQGARGRRLSTHMQKPGNPEGGSGGGKSCKAPLAVIGQAIRAAILPRAACTQTMLQLSMLLTVPDAVGLGGLGLQAGQGTGGEHSGGHVSQPGQASPAALLPTARNQGARSPIHARPRPPGASRPSKQRAIRAPAGGPLHTTAAAAGRIKCCATHLHGPAHGGRAALQASRGGGRAPGGAGRQPGQQLWPAGCRA